MNDRPGNVRASVATFLGAGLAIVLLACSPNVTPMSTSPASPAASGAATDGPLPTPVSTATSVARPCALADLQASHGLVEGAAGSRFTTVVLVAATDCSVDAFPAVGLRDAAGAILVSAAAGGPGRIDLITGTNYATNVRLGNWCADQPAFPLDLAILIGGAELPVTGSAFADEGDLPPCSGSGGPILEATAWEGPP